MWAPGGRVRAHFRGLIDTLWAYFGHHRRWGKTAAIQDCHISSRGGQWELWGLSPVRGKAGLRCECNRGGTGAQPAASGGDWVVFQDCLTRNPPHPPWHGQTLPHCPCCPSNWGHVSVHSRLTPPQCREVPTWWDREMLPISWAATPQDGALVPLSPSCTSHLTSASHHPGL